MKSNKTSPPEIKTYRGVQLTMIRELRLSKSADAVKKARAELDAILGTAKKPLWGRGEFPALKEHGLLLEEEEKWSEGFGHWSALVKILARTAGRGEQAKEFYLEAYYHMIFCFLKAGAAKPDKASRTKILHQAGAQIAQFEQSWEDFGSDASKKRFTELLASDPGLKEQFEAARNKKKR